MLSNPFAGINFLQTFREIPDLIFSYSSKGSMIHVIYCFLVAVKFVWSSERDVIDNNYHRDLLYQISSAYFK
jgi:hypothetical protein